MAKAPITVTGYVGRDPKPHVTSSGTPIATFPVGENHYRWDGRSREWVRTGTSWFYVTCKWGLADHVQRSVETGDPVIVTGKLKIAEWNDTNGVKQVTADIDATSVGHDLRRGTAKFKKAERPGTSGRRDDEEGEIRNEREEPPVEPPDPFASLSGNGSDATEPPAEPPADAADAAEDNGDEPPFDDGVSGVLQPV
jgi:single-strand DNA-binding protein